MPDEPMLREKAREAIRSGRLPTQPPSRTFGGQGSGKPCPVCGDVISRDQVELETEFNRHGSQPGIDRHFFHPRCYAAWEFERTKVPGKPPEDTRLSI